MAFVLTAQVKLTPPSNTAAIVNQISNQLNGIQTTVKVNISNSTTKQLQNVNKQLSQTTKATKAASDGLRGFGEQSALALRRFGGFVTATFAFRAFISSFNQGIKNAIDFQRELIRISQVTDRTTSGLKGLTSEITRLSKTFGVESAQLLKASRILAQTGLSISQTQDALEALAKADISPTFGDIIKVTEGSIAIFRQFGKEAKDLEGILSSINSVSAKFAVEAEDIITAVRRTGGAFAAAGGDLNDLIGLFTSVRSTTRESAESIATGFRTIFTRLQRTRTINFLETLGIELRNLEGQFVGPFEAVKRLSLALNQLSSRDPRFAQITEELGGFRQVSKVIPLIQKFTVAEQARAVAIRGTNSLSEDAAVAQQALAIQFQKVREEFGALTRDLVNSDTFQKLAQFALKTANAFIKVADALRPLIPLLAGLALPAIFSGAGQFSRGFFSKILPGKAEGGYISKFARGGMVPGTGNRDTVPAMLTPGEFVIRKKAVQKLGPDRLQKMNTGGFVKMAEGGELGENAPAKVAARDQAYRRANKIYNFSNLRESAIQGPTQLKDIAGRLSVDVQDPAQATKYLNQKYGFSSRRQAFAFLKELGLVVNQRGRIVNDLNAAPGELTAGPTSVGKVRSYRNRIRQVINPSTSPVPSGRVFSKVSIGGKDSPAFGGVFLTSVSGDLDTVVKAFGSDRKTKANAAQLKGRPGATTSSKDSFGLMLDNIARLKGVSREALDQVRRIDVPLELNTLNPKSQRLFRNNVDKGIRKLVDETASALLGNKSHQLLGDAIQRLDLNAVEGQIFESVVGQASGTALQKAGATFDFPQGLGASALFPKHRPGVALDAKRTLDLGESGAGKSGTVSPNKSARGKGGDTIMEKVRSVLLNRSSNVALPRVAGKIQLLNRGGKASGVPALLTPGEFVVDKQTVNRVGIPTLNKLNHAEKFANGGLVGLPKGARIGQLNLRGGRSGRGKVAASGTKRFRDLYGADALAGIDIGADVGNLKINDDAIGKFKDKIVAPVFSSANKAFRKLAGPLGSKYRIESDQNAVDTISGFLQEGFISNFAKVTKQTEKNAPFDFVLSAKDTKSLDNFVSPKASGAGTLFLDSKTSSVPPSSIIRKAINQGLYDQEIKRFLPARRASGGIVPGQGNSDTVPALLTPGEFVLRKKAVQSLGKENVQKLNRGGTVKRFASGGSIGSAATSSGFGIGAGFLVLSGIAATLTSQFDQLSGATSEVLGTISNLAIQFGAFSFAIKSLVDVGKRAPLETTPVRPQIEAIQEQNAGLNKRQDILVRRSFFAKRAEDDATIKALRTTNPNEVDKQVDRINKSRQAQRRIDEEATFNQDVINANKRLRDGLIESQEAIKKENKAREASQRGLEILGVSLAVFAAAATSYATIQNKRADDLAKQGKTEGLISARGQAGAASNSILGAFGGFAVVKGLVTVLGSLNPIIATGIVVASALGFGLKGWNDSVKEAEKEVARIEFKPVIDKLRGSFKLIDKGLDTTINQLPNIRAGLDATRQRLNVARGDDRTNVLSDAEGFLPDLNKAFESVAKTSQTFKEFEKTVGKDTIAFFSELSGIPVKSVVEQYKAQISLQNKANEIQASTNKINEEFATRLRNIVGLTSALQDAALSVQAFESNISNFTAFGAGGGGTSTFNNTSEVFGRLDRISDIPQFNKAVDQVAAQLGKAGQSLGDEIKAVATVTQNLPDILLKLRNQNVLGNEGQFSSRLQAEIANLLKGDSNQANISRIITSRVESIIGPEGKEQKILDEITKDLEGTVGSLTKGFDNVANVFKEGSAILDKQLQNFVAGLGRRRELSLAASESRNRTVGLQAQRATFLQSIRPGATPDLNIGRNARAAVLRNTLGRTDAAAGSNVQNIVGRLSSAQQAVLKFENQLSSSANLTSQEIAKLRVAESAQRERVTRLNNALKLLADSVSENAQLQQELSRLEEARKNKFNIVSGAVFGDQQSRRNTAQTFLGAQALARGASIEQIAPELRGGIQQLLRQFADVALPAFGGKTGRDIEADVIRDSLVRSNVNPLLAGQIADQTRTSAEERIIQEISANIDKSIQAQQAITANIEKANRSLTTNLADSLNSFIKKLESLFIEREVRRIQSEIDNKDVEVQLAKRTEGRRQQLNQAFSNGTFRVQSQEDVQTLTNILSRSRQFSELEQTKRGVSRLEGQGRGIVFDALERKEGVNGIVDRAVRTASIIPGIDPEALKGLRGQINVDKVAELQNLASKAVKIEGSGNTAKLVPDFTARARAQEELVSEISSILKGVADKSKDAIATQQGELRNQISPFLESAFGRGGGVDRNIVGLGSGELRKTILPIVKGLQGQTIDPTQGNIGRLNDELSALRKQLADRRTSKFNSGGLIPGQGSFDTVPAMLTRGEYVLRKEAVNSIGVDNLNRMNVMGFASGGPTDAEAKERYERRRRIYLLAKKKLGFRGIRQAQNSRIPAYSQEDLGNLSIRELYRVLVSRAGQSLKENAADTLLRRADKVSGGPKTKGFQEDVLFENRRKVYLEAVNKLGRRRIAALSRRTFEPLQAAQVDQLSNNRLYERLAAPGNKVRLVEKKYIADLLNKRKAAGFNKITKQVNPTGTGSILSGKAVRDKLAAARKARAAISPVKISGSSPKTQVVPTKQPSVASLVKESNDIGDKNRAEAEARKKARFEAARTRLLTPATQPSTPQAVKPSPKDTEIKKRNVEYYLRAKKADYAAYERFVAKNAGRPETPAYIKERDALKASAKVDVPRILELVTSKTLSRILDKIAGRQRFAKGGQVGGSSSRGTGGGSFRGLQIDQESIQAINAAFTTFSSAADKLAKSVETLNGLQVQHQIGGTVEVIINGAEAFSQLNGPLQDLINAKIVDGINKMLAEKFPNAGQFRGE